MTAAIIHRPLSNVPETAMKFVVGAMSTTFGMFWGSGTRGRRAGSTPPLWQSTFVLVVALAAVQIPRRTRLAAEAERKLDE